MAPSTKVLTQDCETRGADTKSAQISLKDLSAKFMIPTHFIDLKLIETDCGV